MPKISVHGKGIESTTFEVGVGVRLFDVLLEKGLYVENDCGGLGTCGKCKIIVNGREELACHYIVDDDIDVTIRHTLSKPAHSKELYHIDPVSPILTKSSSGTIKFDYKGTTYTVNASGDSCKAVLFDIGTTTVRGQVLDVRTGDILDEVAVYNKQIPYGSDVISRIVYSEKHDAVALLQKKLIETINEIIGELNVKKDDIDLVFCAGNSIITHFLYGTDPKPIRYQPYLPSFTEKDPIPAIQIGIDVSKRAILISAPLVASYVGGDIVAGIIGSGLYKTENTTLYIDIGTNGEIVLGNKDWMISAAASAGPNFEGGEIDCGMLAQDGAIDDVTIEEERVKVHTIGDTEPLGICGCGLINTIASLFKNQWIDKKGQLIAGKMGKYFSDGRFMISDSIYLSQTDIDNFIKAKGAVFAACQTLISKVGISIDEIKDIIISGSFGKHLDIDNAVKLGMLPKIKDGSYRFIGNGTLLGMHMAIIDKDTAEEFFTVSERVTYVELSEEPGYMDNFSASLFIPHTDISLFE